MLDGKRVALVIPALDEEDAIGPVLDAVDRDLVDDLVVADNGSSDGTRAQARARGARVVVEPRRGYGSACLAAIATLGRAEILAFLDGDGSDDPRELSRVLAPLRGSPSRADVVIGSRVLGEAEPGALTPVQRFGNALTCRLVERFWGVRYTDLGPFRALTRSALDRLSMSDPDFGWTIEMQVKAARLGLDVIEVPVSRRHRAGGRSKVSGTIGGSVRAGVRILSYVFGAKLDEIRGR